MDKKNYYDDIAREKIEILTKSIKKRIESENISIGQLEEKIGVSKGYFSRIIPNGEKKGRTPDINIFCKLVEYFGLDYNIFFFAPLEEVTLKERSVNETIYKFLTYLEVSTEQKQIVWTCRLNMAITAGTYIPSKGIKLGLYGEKYRYDSDSEKKKYLRYEKSSEWFECNLQEGEYIELCEVWDKEKERAYYELILNGEVVFATITEENEGYDDRFKSNSRILKSLYLYLSENKGNVKQKKLPSLEAMEIIRKYIKED